jgi:Chalcone isomerase-like
MRASHDPVGMGPVSRRHCLVAAATLGISLHAGTQAQPAVPEDVKQALGPSTQLRGSARLRMWGLLIYDARLWVRPGFAADQFEAHPLVLDLTYARSLKGAAIAERSIDEMRLGRAISSAQAQQWLGFMKQAFPDVDAGDRLSGVWNPETGTTTVSVNGAKPKRLVDKDFGRSFFGIWLAPHTSQPALRLELIGTGG